MTENDNSRASASSAINPTLELEWDDRDQPISRLFDDIYYSKENGLAESRYVFIDGNRLEERWKSMPAGSVFTIIETGFGTGLNFLATWQLWTALQTDIAPYCELRFISIEKYPLNSYDLAQAHRHWPELAKYSARLIDNYPPIPWHTMQSLDLTNDTGAAASHSVSLSLIFDDVEHAFKHLGLRPNAGPRVRRSQPRWGEKAVYADAWFLDGFAPSKNPDMWSEALFLEMANNSHNGTTVATFTAAGAVRRGLQSTGFDCHKRRGFGRKREMITGKFSRQNTDKANAPVSDTTLSSASTKGRPKENGVELAKTAEQTTPRTLARNSTGIPTWPYTPRDRAQTHAEKTVVVIGGGLAGCHGANALARKGFKVTLVDSVGLASGASGNLQGAVYTRLSASPEALSTFNRAAQLYADGFYSHHGYYARNGAQCGVLHLANNNAAKKRLSSFASLLQPSTPFEFVDEIRASELSGLHIEQSGLFSSQSGWLSPQKLCHDLVQHPNIEVIEHFHSEKLTFDGSQWLVSNTTHDALQGHSDSALTTPHTIKASFCVVANASKAKHLSQCSRLPLQAIRGQVSHVRSNDKTQKLKTVLCGDGYFTPALEIHDALVHSAGATFTLNNNRTVISNADNQSNIARARALSADLENTPLELYQPQNAKVGFRCGTPDYLPIVGPVPVVEAMQRCFAPLSKKANADVDACGEYYPGLYCCVGFGSRGLAYTPIAAAVIADLISGRYLSIDATLYRHIHPARFVMRSLIKNKPLA